MSQLEIFEKSAKSLPDALVEHELLLWKRGQKYIAGVDEVGRGPLAGPVVACACILPKGVIFHGIKDSKLLPTKERERLCHFLTTHPDVHWALGTVSHEKIDEINILRASLLAMKLAVDALPIKPEFVLVDGRDKPPIEFECRAIIKGDMLSQSIGAASIIAKVHRDAMMDELHKEYPLYGFNKHKGYATQEHKRAIEKYGLCPIHRKSFTTKHSATEQPTLF